MNRHKLFRAAAFFILITIIMTFPLVFRITSYIPGFFSTDEPFGHLWNSWKVKYAWENHLDLKKAPLIHHPFVLASPVSKLTTPWAYLDNLLSCITTPVITYNLQVLLNFILSGMAVYLLVLYLTKNSAGAFLSGIIFAFCPYQFARTWQHLGLTYNQWIPLVIFSIILLREKAGIKYIFLLAVSLLLLFSFDYTVSYLGLAAALFISAYILARERDAKFLKRLLFAGFIAGIILFFQVFPYIKSALTSCAPAAVNNPYRRSFDDLFAQSARPLSFFLPAAAHPVFGRFSEQFIGSALYGISFTEHTLYLGWTPLLLAFYAFRVWRKNKKDNFYIGLFIFLAAAAWLFSQPPWWKIGPLKIYMPPFFMYKILPMFRAYCRFGIVVMLAAAVLAGFGLKFILDNFKSRRLKALAAALCCGLVLFEFWNWPPYKVIDVAGFPEAYHWLKAQAGDIVIAEYPLDVEGPNEKYKLYQTKHEKKIINGAFPGTYPHTATAAITRLSELNTARLLKARAVKYALVHKDGYLDTSLIADREELEKISLNPGLKLIKSFPAQDCPRKDIMCIQQSGPIDVYEVIALPQEAQVK